MHTLQAENFIAILRAAMGHGKRLLEAPDWELLAQWARLQSLPALFYAGASQYEEFQQWDGCRQLQEETIAAVVAQSNRTQFFLEVYQSLIEKGIHLLVLKGFLVRQLYGDLADYRPSSDEDLYVRPEEAVWCRMELRKLGFQVTYPQDVRKLADPLQEMSLDHISMAMHLDLHPNFFEQNREDLRLSSRYFKNSHDHAVPITVDGITLWTLDETHHYLYLFLHLAKHFKGAGVGIKQMLDLLVAEEAWRDKIDWEYIKRAAEELHCGKLYGAILAVGKQLGFVPKELFPLRDPGLLLADCLEGGVYGLSDPSRIYGSVITTAAVNNGQNKGVLKSIFPSLEYMARGWAPLKRHPWLLPVGYLKRFYKVLVTRRQGGVALSAIQKGQERTKLLKAYGIFEEKER